MLPNEQTRKACAQPLLLSTHLAHPYRQVQTDLTLSLFVFQYEIDSKWIQRQTTKKTRIKKAASDNNAVISLVTNANKDFYMNS